MWVLIVKYSHAKHSPREPGNYERCMLMWHEDLEKERERLKAYYRKMRAEKGPQYEQYKAKHREYQKNYYAKHKDLEKGRERARAYHQRIHTEKGPAYEKRLETHRKSNQNHYERHKESILSERHQEQQEIRAWYRQYKRNIMCIRCGENHPACLQFHHRDRSEKIRDLARYVFAARSLKKFIQELEKCDVLCANCHMIEHWKENWEEWDEAADLQAYEELKRKLNETEGWYKRHRMQRKLAKLETLIWYKRYKRTLACERCGFNHPACLHFHHIRGDKEMGVSELVYNVGDIDRVKHEISKCEVLCANCHAKQHWNWVEDEE